MVHAEVSTDGQAVTLDLAWNEVELVKLIPGSRHDSRTRQWQAPLSWAALVQLRGVFGAHLELGEQLTTWAWRERDGRVDLANGLRQLTEYPGVNGWLYPFQHAGVQFMRVAGSGLLGDEMGVGKTVQALTFLHELTAYPALVVCPNSVKHHWVGRAAEWTVANTYVLDGGTVANRRTLAAAREDPMALVIVNYEAVRALSRLAPFGSVKLKRCRECDPQFGEDLPASRCHVHRKELNDFYFETVILDEAHRVGEPRAQQTRAVWAVIHAPSVRYRWALTGTPDHVERLWSIMHAVCPLEYPVKGDWMDRYALRSWNAFGGLDVVGLRPDTREELFKILDPRFRRMLKSVVLPQLPPKVREVRHAKLSPSQRRAYDELEQRLYTRLEDGELYVAKNRLVSRTRLLQFAAATIRVEKPDADDPATWQVTMVAPSPKLEVLDEVLDELGDQARFVVACEHRDLVQLAAERLGARGIAHDLVIGGTPPAQTERACQALKTGTLRAIVMTIAAGGVGVDLSGADTQIFLQRSWSLINQVQAEARLDRIGQTADCIRLIDVVTQDTREVRQVEVLHEKLYQLEEITRDKVQVQQQLTVTDYADPHFTELVTRLDELNGSYATLLASDVDTDLEEAAA